MQLYYTLDQLSEAGHFYIPMTSDINPGFPFTDVAPDASLAEPKYSFEDRKWFDASAEAAQQRQQAAEAAAQKAQQQVTLQGQQLQEVGQVLSTASTIISAPSVAATISDSDALKLADLWPTWAVGNTYSKGQVVVYNGQTYRHHADSTEAATEQLNPVDATYMWTPITLTASGDVVWAAPTGYQNAYKKGDVVLYSDGKHYTSLIDGNTQVPGTDTRYWVEVSDASTTTAAAAATTTSTTTVKA